MLSDGQISELVADFRTLVAQIDNLNRLSSPPLKIDEHAALLSMLDQHKASTRDELGRGDYTLASFAASVVSARAGLTTNPLERRQLEQAIMRAGLDAIDEAAARLRGDLSSLPCMPPAEAFAPVTAQDHRPNNETRPTAEMIEIVAAEAPAIGLILRALSGNIEIDRVVVVDTWLRDAWPDALNDLWPDRGGRNAGKSPSIAKDINHIIRTMPQVQLSWSGNPSTDASARELAVHYPLIAAALEVSRLCSCGDLDDFGDKVTATKSFGELAKRVPIPRGSTLAEGLFRRLAKICIPDEKVTGGGRRPRRD